MNKENVLDYCNALDERAKTTNCEYEIFAVAGDSFSVKVMDGEIEDYNVNDYIGVSFRIKKNGRMGYASTTALDVDGIEALIDSAIDNALVIESNDEQFIFEGSEKYSHPKIYEPKIDKMTPSEKIALAQKIEKTALSHGGKIVRTMGSVVFTETGTRIIKNSKGLDLEETSNVIGAYVIPIAKDGADMNSGFGYRVICGEPDIGVEELVNEACEEASDFCAARSFAGGNVKTVLKSSAMCDLLETFLPVFSSDNAQKGISMLGGKEGQSVGSECLTVIDDALADHRFGSRSFDSEGVASQTNVIIENGVLKTLLYNLKTAKKAGVFSTANACKGSYSSPIGISGTNFMIKPSELSLEDLLERAGDGIMITSLEGLHSGANSATGDFSLSAKGYLIKNGKRDRAVNGLTVSGNFYALLKNIKCVGNDLKQNPFGTAVGSPSVLLDAPMSVSGGGD